MVCQRFKTYGVTHKLIRQPSIARCPTLAKAIRKNGTQKRKRIARIGFGTKFLPTFTEKTNQWKQKTPHFGRNSTFPRDFDCDPTAR